MTYVYHVTREDTSSKKLIRVGSKIDLLDEIRSKFLCNQFSVQYAIVEEGLGEIFVDMDSIEDLPDKGKLLIVPKFDVLVQEQPLQEPVSPIAPLPVSLTSALSTPTTTSPQNGLNSQNHLAYYCLPKFPRDIQQQLDVRDASIICDRSMRSKIVRVLFGDLLDKVGWFPSRDDYNLVCLSLITAYPFLEDKEVFGRMNGGRVCTWLESLKQKFKDARRPLTNEESLKATKEKYGRKGLPKRLLVDANSDSRESPRRKRSKFVEDANNGEDDASIASHVAMLKVQWNKSNPDLSIVSTRMEKTYADRRALVFNGESTQAILEKYPTLRYAEQMIDEAKRITGVDFRDQMVKFFTSEIVDKILNDNSATRAIVEEAMQSNVNSVRRSAAVVVLPSFFGDKMDRWIQWKTPHHSVPDSIIYPCVVVDTGDCGQVLNPANRVVVLVDNQELCECPDIFSAVVLMLTAYYVFDITYPITLENTMKFVDGRILATCAQKMSAAIQRRVNILYS